MKKSWITAFLVINVLLVPFAFSHHSGAGIDRTKTVTVEGTVKQFKWGNPHSWLEIEVANSKGGVDLWNWEMNPPAFLVQSGWKSTAVKIGDKVKVTGRPFISGDPGGIFVSVTLPNGQVLGSGRQPSQLGGPPAATPQVPAQK